MSSNNSSAGAWRLDLIVLAAFILAVAAGSCMDLFQWDTEAYFWAGRAWMSGSDPYDPMLLTKMTGKNPLPFVYPPTLLPLFGFLSQLPLAVFHVLFITVKIGALALLIRCWRRILGEHSGPLIWYAMLGFHGALFSDLGSGNIALFETLLVWLALESWVNGETGRFAAWTIFAGQFKLAPFAFLGMLAWHAPRRNRVLSASCAAMAGITGALVAVAPDAWRKFLSLAAVIDERGTNNQCQVSLWRDLLGAETGSVFSGTAVIPYLLVSAGILLITWNVGYKASLQGKDARRHAVFLAVLAFALTAPRFKTYSFLLLIPAAIAVFETTPISKSIKYIFLAFGILPFMPMSDTAPGPVSYLPLAWAAWFWWKLIRHRSAPEPG